MIGDAMDISELNKVGRKCPGYWQLMGQLGKPGWLVLAWRKLSRPRRRYASELVSRFGWPVRLALQHAARAPYDPWVYDWRDGSCHEYAVNRRTGHIGGRVDLAGL